MTYNTALWPAALCLLAACACGGGHDEEIAKAAQDFATSYFNYDLRRAAKLATGESQAYIAMVASNIGDEQVSQLRDMESGAEIAVDDTRLCEGDTTAEATVRVSGYLPLHSLEPGRAEPADATFRLKLVRRGGAWKVNLQGIPRRLIEK